MHIRNKEESQYETVPDITPQEEKTITDDVLDDVTETTDVTEGTDGVTEDVTENVAEVSEEVGEIEKATEVTAGPVLNMSQSKTFSILEGWKKLSEACLRPFE